MRIDASPYSLSWVNFLDVTNWDSGASCKLGLQIQPSLVHLYRRITEAQAIGGGLSFGQLLVIMLLIIGSLFLVIQTVAFVMGVSLARSITGSIHELFEGTRRVQAEDLSHRIRVRTARPVRRACLVVQLDGRDHRGIARAEGRQGAAPAGTATGARHPDLAPAVRDAVLRRRHPRRGVPSGPRDRRRLLRFLPARRRPHRPARRRRLRQGRIGGPVHGGTQGTDARLVQDAPVAAGAARRGQSRPLGQPRAHQLRDDDVRGARCASADADARPRRAHATHSLPCRRRVSSHAPAGAGRARPRRPHGVDSFPLRGPAQGAHA